MIHGGCDDLEKQFDPADTKPTPAFRTVNLGTTWFPDCVPCILIPPTVTNVVKQSPFTTLSRIDEL